MPILWYVPPDITEIKEGLRIKMELIIVYGVCLLGWLVNVIRWIVEEKKLTWDLIPCSLGILLFYLLPPLGWPLFIINILDWIGLVDVDKW